MSRTGRCGRTWSCIFLKDTTSWSTDKAFRKECLLQLQAAIESEQEELRAELVAEVGCPILTTYGPQLDAPLREALKWPAEMIDRFQWKRELGLKATPRVGKSGQFDVLVNGEVVASKEKVGLLRKLFGDKGFPDEAAAVAAVRAKAGAATAKPA